MIHLAPKMTHNDFDLQFDLANPINEFFSKF